MTGGKRQRFCLGGAESWGSPGFVAECRNRELVLPCETTKYFIRGVAWEYRTRINDLKFQNERRNEQV